MDHDRNDKQARSSVIVNICDQFEKAWDGGEPPSINDFLKFGDFDESSRRELLCALVAIDMEKRWQLAQKMANAATLDHDHKWQLPLRPRLADYVVAYSELGPTEGTVTGVDMSRVLCPVPLG